MQKTSMQHRRVLDHEMSAGILIICAIISMVISMDLANVSINLGTVVGVLYALVAVMLIIVLYHILFIVVDARKIVKRFEDITSQVEGVILKPLSMADQAIQWVMEFIDQKRRQHHKHVTKPKQDE